MKRIGIICSILYLSSGGGLLYAQIPLSETRLTPQAPKIFTLFTDYNFYYNHSSTHFSKTASHKVSRLGLNLNYSPQEFGLKIDGDIFLYIYDPKVDSLRQKPLFIHNIKEFNYAFQLDTAILSFGRKLYTWSEADELWNHGFWQPRFTWNTFTPNQSGLFGFFFENRFPKIQILTYASPIYIPEFGPEWDLKDGMLTSQNPWFSSPRNTIHLGSETNIRYNLNIPSLTKLLLKPSLGISGIFKTKKNFFTRFSVIYKPLNQLLNEAEVKIKLNPQQPFVKATLTPNGYYHGLATLEFGIKDKSSLSLWLSGTFQKSFIDKVDKKIIAQRLPAYTTSTTGFIAYNFSKISNRKSQLYFSHTVINNGYEIDSGEFADKNNNHFSPIYNYFNTSQVGFQQDILTLFGKPLAYQFNVLYDFEQKISAFATTFQWKLTKDITTYLNTNNFWRHNKKAISAKGLLGASLSNDSILTGASYGF